MKFAIFKFYLIFSLFVSISVYATSESNYVIYKGGSIVDFDLGVCENKDVTLYSDGIEVREWTNKDPNVCEYIYYSDDSTAYSRTTYRVVIKKWQASEWVAESDTTFVVDTNFFEGTIHNSNEWLDKLDRNEIDWSNAIVQIASDNGVGVTLADGNMYIEDTSIQDSWFLVDGAVADVFMESLDINATEIIIKNLKGSTNHSSDEDYTTLIDKSIFSGDAKLNLLECSDLRVHDNTFTKGAIEVSTSDQNQAGSNLIQNNHGDLSISVTGDNNSENIVKDNICSTLSLYGNNNTAKYNIVTESLSVYGSNNKCFANHSNSGEMLLKLDGSDNEVYNNHFVVTTQNDIYVTEVSGTNNMFKNNTVTINSRCGGIRVENDHNTIEHNTLEYNYPDYNHLYENGIFLISAHDITVKNNLIKNMSNTAIYLYDADNNQIINNAVIGKEGYSSYLYRGIFVDASSDTNTIAFNHLYTNSTGIRIEGDDNGLHENIISKHREGVVIADTAENTWVYNNIFLELPDYSDYAIDDGINTSWNKNKITGTNIIGGQYIAGNYWDGDYTGNDADGDGLGDSAYIITAGSANAQDNYPLVSPKGHTISTSITSHRFTTTSVGESSSPKLISIKNIGDGSLNILAITLDGKDASNFSIDNDNCSSSSLSATQECTFTVSFSPISEGSKSATIIIDSNDISHQSVNITLLGGSSKQILVPIYYLLL